MSTGVNRSGYRLCRHGQMSQVVVDEPAGGLPGIGRRSLAVLDTLRLAPDDSLPSTKYIEA